MFCEFEFAASEQHYSTKIVCIHLSMAQGSLSEETYVASNYVHSGPLTVYEGCRDKNIGQWNIGDLYFVYIFQYLYTNFYSFDQGGYKINGEDT